MIRFSFLSSASPLRFFIVAYFGLSMLAPINARAQKLDSEKRPLAVGDLIEFSYMGKSLRANIKGFHIDWPKVEFEYKGRKVERSFPNSQVKLIKSEAGVVLTAEMRTWTDSTGRFKVEAKLFSNQDGIIKLEKKDGRYVSFPVERLSDADQEYAKKLQAAIDAELDKNNPFAGGQYDPDFEMSKEGLKATSTLLPSIGVKSNLNPVTLSAEVDSQLTPDPASQPIQLTSKDISYEPNLTKPSFFRGTNVSFSPNKTTLGLAYNSPFEPTSDLFTFDLESGKTHGPLSIPMQEATLIAISDDGQTMVTHRKNRSSTPGSLDFWELGKEDAKQTASWETATFSEAARGIGFRPPNFGHFVAPNRLLTIGQQTVLWNVETAEPIYSFDAAKSSVPTLTPAGNQIVVSASNKIFFVDVKTGRTIGVIDCPAGDMIRLAVSPDGKFLAGVSKTNSEIFIWDLANKELRSRFGTTESTIGHLLWCTDDYLLVNQTKLLNVSLKTIVWHYSIPRNVNSWVATALDGQFWLVRKSIISPIKLPHTRLNEQTKKIVPEDLLTLYPGAKISIRLDVALGAANVDSMRKKLTESFEENDIEVVDDAELELVCEFKKHEQQTLLVSDAMALIPFRRDTEEVTFTPTSLFMSLQRNGKVLWRKSKAFQPQGLLQVKNGETTQQAVERLCEPQLSFITAYKFPRYLSLMPNGKPLGNSSILDASSR